MTSLPMAVLNFKRNQMSANDEDLIITTMNRILPDTIRVFVDVAHGSWLCAHLCYVEYSRIEERRRLRIYSTVGTQFNYGLYDSREVDDWARDFIPEPRVYTEFRTSLRIVLIFLYKSICGNQVHYNMKQRDGFLLIISIPLLYIVVYEVLLDRINML